MNQLQYMHYRPMTNDSRGGATVAIMTQKNSEGKEKALVTIARCGPNDVFCRKVGRAIAAGRMRAFMEGRPAMVSCVREIDIDEERNLKSEIADALYDEMAEHGLF